MNLVLNFTYYMEMNVETTSHHGLVYRLPRCPVTLLLLDDVLGDGRTASVLGSRPP